MNMKNKREFTGTDPTDFIRIIKDYFLPSPFLLHIHKFDTFDET